MNEPCKYCGHMASRQSDEDCPANPANERLEFIRQKVQDGVMWANVADHIQWTLEELVLDHVITKAEMEWALKALDWTIVILPTEEQNDQQTYNHTEG